MEPERLIQTHWPSNVLLVSESSEKLVVGPSNDGKGAHQQLQGPLRPKTAQQSIVIDRPIEDVFAAGGALDKRCRWQRGIVGGELAFPNMAGLGTRCVETRTAANGVSELWELEITQFEHCESLTVVAVHGPVRIIERHGFRRDPAGVGRTRYTLGVEITGSQLIGVNVQKQIVESLIRFRDCMEAPGGIFTERGASRLRKKLAGGGAGATDPEAGQGGPYR